MTKKYSENQTTDSDPQGYGSGNSHAGTDSVPSHDEMCIRDSIWGVMGYTVLLCFTLFKTGSLAKGVFSAH